jgi:orotate phosphoribosyltransferase
MKAIEALQAEGALIASVVSVVDRQEGAAENFKAVGIPFTALLTTADFK